MPSRFTKFTGGSTFWFDLPVADAKGMPVGTYEVFADNFKGAPIISSPYDARFRPCGLAEGPDGSLYVSDSEKGRVWRIIYVGGALSPPISSNASTASIQAPAPLSESLAAGAKIYMEGKIVGIREHHF